MAPLLTLWIFFHRDRVVRFAVWTDLDVRQALAMAVTGMRGRLTACVVLAELSGRKLRRLGLLRGRGKENTNQPEGAQRAHRNTSPLLRCNECSV